MANSDETRVAKVTGVLQGNSNVRVEMLKRNYWSDREYTKYGGDFVKYTLLDWTKTTEPKYKDTGLIGFTHEDKTEFAKKNNAFYLPFPKYPEKFEVKREKWDTRKWEGDYLINYTTANPLTFVADSKFTEEMSIAALSNDSRYVYKKYLTPSLLNFYGSNPKATGEFGKYAPFSPLGREYENGDGRIADIGEVADVRVVDTISREVTVGNLNETHLLNQIENGKQLEGDSAKYSILEQEYYPSRQNPEDWGEPYYSGTTNGSKHFDEGDTVRDSVNNRYRYGTQERGLVDDLFLYEDSLPNGLNEDKDISDTVIGVTGNRNLLDKTNNLFRNHKIATLHGRFHTTESDSGITYKKEFTDTAKTPEYGNSHGRNLLKKNHVGQKTNNYEDPYCRVWTYHHMYDRLSKAIRPFGDIVPSTIEEVQKINENIRSKIEGGAAEDGGKYLGNNTVLNSSNGMVNIAPSKNDGVDIKKCMFSIENLAWKDVPKHKNYLSKEQRGPNGGRIMWFPPYDLSFQESVNVDWDQNTFIGRGEKVYTYKNTDRTGTLSFTLLIDHPGVIDLVKKDGADISMEKMHQEILRFFAGCSTFEPTMLITPENNDEEIVRPVKNPDGDTVIEPINDDKDSTPVEVPSDEEAKTLKFYVYFPNNYSGNRVAIGKTEWMQKGYSDSDWYYYLLAGHGTTVSTIPETWENAGYECNNRNGLGNADKIIKANTYRSGCTQWQDRTEIDPRDKRYSYRVDFDLRQVLIYDVAGENYKDSYSYGLNVSNTNTPKDATNTFAGVALALLKMNKDFTSGNFDPDEIAGYLQVTDEVKKLYELFTAEDFKICSIDVKGAATLQDSKVRSGKIPEHPTALNNGCTNSLLLAFRRAKSVGSFLKNSFGELLGDAKFNDEQYITVPSLVGDEVKSVNGEAKKQRYAEVTIKYNPPKITDITELETENGTISQVTPKQEEVVVEPDVEENEKKKENLLTEPVRRYETEAEYFEKIKFNNPLIYKTLTEKFKYFTPAFHSISPEGFNARLTFLQQCTRQGHTIEASDVNGYAKTAGNLSFGRMPVCVLRLGDFINTRIIINNLSINYADGGMQWDLNPEGIGVQPMFAKVNLGITIIGGQSLSGPISRLQNAVSFNYYANTGVYDDRSDRIQISSGEVSNDEVRTVNNGNESYSVVDKSAYVTTKEKYIHMWNPTPDIRNVTSKS